MKFRNFVLLLLVGLTLFAFASCKQDVKEPQAASGEIYKLTAVKGVYETSVFTADKFRLIITPPDGGEAEDVIKFSFRSTRAIEMFNVRDDNSKWVYQDEDVEDYVTAGEDGWSTFKYIIPETYEQGNNAATPAKIPSFYVDIMSRHFLKGDIVEVKDVTYNGKPMVLTAANVATGSYVEPTFEIVKSDEAWEGETRFGLFFYEAKIDSVNSGGDPNPDLEIVAKGGKATLANIVEDGYELLGVYTDVKALTDETLRASTAFDKDSTVINESMDLYILVKGVDRKVKLENTTLEDLTVENGKAIGTLEDPVLEGSVFKGWFADENLSDAYDLNTLITSDTTIYAKFVPERTVTFNLNGHGTAINPIKVADGDEFTLPSDPTESGWRFKGWFTDSNCADDAAYTLAAVKDGDLELHAKWVAAETVAVTYMLNDGTEAVYLETTAFVDETVKEPEDPEREGFRFLGWFDDADNGAEYTFDETVLKEDGDKVFYAHWIEQVVRLTATHGRNEETDKYDKYQLSFSDSTLFNEGTELTVVFRSTRPITEYGLRATSPSIKWMYEQINNPVSSNPNNWWTELSGPDADGWITASYKFGKKNYKNEDLPNNAYPNSSVYLQFRGHILKDDYLEIRDISITDGESVVSMKDDDIKKIVKADYVVPTVEIVDNGEWTENPLPDVVYFFTTPNNGDNYKSSEANPYSFAVPCKAGTYITKPEDPVREGYTFGGWSKEKELAKQTDDRIWDFNGDKANDGRELYAMWTPVAQEPAP